MAVTRILHFSDVHLDGGFPGVPLRRFMNKRLLGFANLRFHRRSCFADAATKLEALARFAQEQRIDLAICTGDYSHLGTDPELAFARRAIDPFTRFPLGFFTVPGNHDVYMPDSVREAWFDRHFGDLLRSDLPEYACEGPWPQVRLPADGVALLAVNSARPNPELARSSGRIPDQQLAALKRALEDPRVRDRFVIVATHYAPRLSNGRPDGLRHGLENAEELLRVCSVASRGVILHGHVHRRYHVRVPECTLDLFCAGSATHQGREGLWVLDVRKDRVLATPGTWDQSRYVLDQNEAVDLGA